MTPPIPDWPCGWCGHDLAEHEFAGNRGSKDGCLHGMTIVDGAFTPSPDQCECIGFEEQE
jgi:hypothetical protein